ncbi:hypothetical protein HDU83_009680 [Entophlyctis luteolus]|nr:hypothetical protein HDU83_009680 [Entophlyctis luteolus]
MSLLSRLGPRPASNAAAAPVAADRVAAAFRSADAEQLAALLQLPITAIPTVTDPAPAAYSSASDYANGDNDVDDVSAIAAAVADARKSFVRTAYVDSFHQYVSAVQLRLDLPSLEEYPISHVVSYKYYMGVLAFYDEQYKKAKEDLNFCLENFPASSNDTAPQIESNKILLLTYLVPVNLMAGIAASQRLFGISPILRVLFEEIQNAVGKGMLGLFDKLLEEKRKILIDRDVYLAIERCRLICFRNLARRTFLILEKPTRLDLNDILKAVFAAGCSSVDMDEIECMVANLIDKKEFNTIVAGSCILASNAGFINVVTLAGVYSVTVSHVTGNVSRIAISLFLGDFTTLSLVMSILFSFMFGAFISGYMIGDAKFVLGNSYGYALLLESAALFASFLTLKGEYIFGEWCAAFACGLQNAMATTYSGLVVRTTHMTGIATDIGNILGQSCRKENNAEVWRLYVHVPILISYCIGGIFGQIAYTLMKEHSLLVPSCFTGLTAIAYFTLPYIQAAKSQLQSTKAKKNAKRVSKVDNSVGRNSALEVRMIGDPRTVGGVIVTESHAVPGLARAANDLEIREFFGDVNDSLDDVGLAEGGGDSRQRTASQIKQDCGAAKITRVHQEEGSAELLIADKPN